MLEAQKQTHLALEAGDIIGIPDFSAAVISRSSVTPDGHDLFEHRQFASG